MEKKKYYIFENQSESDNNFVLKEKLLFGAGKNCFKSNEEAVTHFEEANKIALEKYEKIVNGIEKLKEEFGNFSYGCDVWVLDDSGLEKIMYIEFNVNGYDFKFSQ